MQYVPATRCSEQNVGCTNAFLHTRELKLCEIMFQGIANIKMCENKKNEGKIHPKFPFSMALSSLSLFLQRR